MKPTPSHRTSPGRDFETKPLPLYCPTGLVIAMSHSDHPPSRGTLSAWIGSHSRHNTATTTVTTQRDDSRYPETLGRAKATVWTALIFGNSPSDRPCRRKQLATRSTKCTATEMENSLPPFMIQKTRVLIALSKIRARSSDVRKSHGHFYDLSVLQGSCLCGGPHGRPCLPVQPLWEYDYCSSHSSIGFGSPADRS